MLIEMVGIEMLSAVGEKSVKNIDCLLEYD
jgi:hypothetical protein